MTASAVAPTRLVALCRAARPICPRCGHGVSGVPVQVANGTLIVCRNRPPRTSAGRTENHCSQHVAVVPAPGGMVLVLALTPAESRELSFGRQLTIADAELSACPSVS